MWHPVLIVRGVFFVLFIFLALLGLVVAAAELNVLYTMGKAMAVGPPWFVILNASFTFLWVFVACAEAWTPNARTGRVGFECGWTGVMSILNFACAVVTITKGPPVYCRAGEDNRMCVDSTFVAFLAWSSFVLMFMYCLTLTSMAFTHSRVRGVGNIWNTTMYDAPWILPVDVSGVESTTSTQVDEWDARRGKGKVDYSENPVFGAADEELEEADVGEHPLTPKLKDYVHQAMQSCKTRGKDSPFPTQPMRKSTTKPVPRYTPRALDWPLTGKTTSKAEDRVLELPEDPFRAETPRTPVSVHNFRLDSYRPSSFLSMNFSTRIHSLLTASDTTIQPATFHAAPPPPPPKGQFVDYHREVYGKFAADVPDPDCPIQRPPRSEWVHASR